MNKPWLHIVASSFCISLSLSLSLSHFLARCLSGSLVGVVFIFCSRCRLKDERRRAASEASCNLVLEPSQIAECAKGSNREEENSLDGTLIGCVYCDWPTFSHWVVVAAAAKLRPTFLPSLQLSLFSSSIIGATKS